MRKHNLIIILIVALINTSCVAGTEIAKSAIAGVAHSVIEYTLPKIEELTKRIVNSGNELMKSYDIPLQIAS